MLNVKKINYDEDSTGGCETCDYGSSYVNEIEITLEDGTYTNIKVDQMYKYALSESDYMQLISNSNTLQDFIINVINKIRDNTYRLSLGFLVHIEDLTIKINDKYVDILKTFEKDKLIYEREK